MLNVRMGEEDSKESNKKRKEKKRRQGQSNLRFNEG